MERLRFCLVFVFLLLVALAVVIFCKVPFDDAIVRGDFFAFLQKAERTIVFVEHVMDGHEVYSLYAAWQDIVHFSREHFVAAVVLLFPVAGDGDAVFFFKQFLCGQGDFAVVLESAFVKGFFKQGTDFFELLDLHFAVVQKTAELYHAKPNVEAVWVKVDGGIQVGERFLDAFFAIARIDGVLGKMDLVRIFQCAVRLVYPVFGGLFLLGESGCKRGGENCCCQNFCEVLHDF